MTNRSAYDGSTISDIEKRIEDGTIFEVSGTITIPNAGGVGEVLFRTGSKTVIIEERTVTTNGDELTYQVFAGPAITSDGTPITPVNRNGLSKNLTEVEVFTGPTYSAEGVGLLPVYMPGATGQGNKTVGQFSGEGHVRILPPNTQYIARVTNNGAKNGATTEVYIMYTELQSPAPFK